MNIHIGWTRQDVFGRAGDGENWLEVLELFLQNTHTSFWTVDKNSKDF